MGVLWPNGSNLETFQQGLKFGNGNEITTVNNIPEYNGQNLLDGSYDTYLQENFSVTRAADLTSGNNATPFGGGVLAGALTDNTVTPISGVSTLVYTQAAGSLNDYFFLPNKTIELKQAGNWSGLVSYIVYSGDASDLKTIVWDATNGDQLTSDLDLIPVAGNPTRFVLANGFYIPSGVTEIAVGFQVVNETISAVFEVDDIELSTDPFRNGTLESDQYSILDNTTGFAGATITGALSSEGGVGGIYSYNSVSGLYTVLRACKISITLSMSSSANGAFVSPEIIKNGSIIAGENTDRNSYITTATVSGESFQEGDTFYVQNGEVNNSDRNIVRVSATAQDSAVITPNGNIDAMVRMYNTNGWGSTNTRIRRMDQIALGEGGTFVAISATQNDGPITVTDSGTDGVEVIIEEGGFYAINYSDLSNVAVTDFGITLNSTQLTTDIFSVSAQDRLAYATSPIANRPNPMSWSGFLNKDDIIRMHGDASAGSGNTDRGIFSIAKIGFKALTAIPRTKVATISDVKASGTQGGTFTSGAWQTRDLNTLGGDSGFLELVANQFRFREVGVYNLDLIFRAFLVNSHQLRLANVTDSVYIYGQSAYADSGSTGSEPATLTTSLVVDDTTKWYEAQHRAGVTRASNGFGVGTGFGNDEKFGTVEITKLR